jgi:hypothetical protein
MPVKWPTARTLDPQPDRQTLTRLTADAPFESVAIWTPDRREVIEERGPSDQPAGSARLIVVRRLTAPNRCVPMR